MIGKREIINLLFVQMALHGLLLYTNFASAPLPQSTLNSHSLNQALAGVFIPIPTAEDEVDITFTKAPLNGPKESTKLDKSYEHAFTSTEEGHLAVH